MRGEGVTIGNVIEGSAGTVVFGGFGINAIEGEVRDVYADCFTLTTVTGNVIAVPFTSMAYFRFARDD